MRNTLIFLMLAATTAFPATAQNWTPRNGASHAAPDARQNRHDANRQARRAPAVPRANAARPAATTPARDTRRVAPVRDARPTRYQGRALRPGESFPGRDPAADQRVKQIERARNAHPYTNDRGREYRYDNGNRGRWDNNWRNDRRYDWRGYRSSNRDRFRLPRYQAPRGYSYRRWSPGYRLEPFFYARSYWIMDPWSYRLPPAYGPYRWVRYYDDVLLVDITTGMVVDVIPDFFWN